MPNWSHGLAGIARALALAGTELDRPDLVEAARRGAEHLVTLGDTGDGGFRVPVQRAQPPDSDTEEFAYGWCHGAVRHLAALPALELARRRRGGGGGAGDWERRCLHSVRTSGVPERLRPGFWDNDGRCCGTAGVGEVFLDAWQRARRRRRPRVRAAPRPTRSSTGPSATAPHACWRFVEHRNAEPLLPPGVGWMQGAAGIAAYLHPAGARRRATADDARRSRAWTTGGSCPSCPAGA